MSPAVMSAAAAPAAPLPRRVLFLIWLNAIGATSVLATELIAVSASLDWALSGLLGLSPAVTLVLAAVSFAICAAIIWLFARQALRVERALAMHAEPQTP